MLDRPGARVAALWFAAILPLLSAPAGDAPAAEWRWNATRVIDYARVSSVQISPDGQWVLYVLSRPRSADAKPGGAWANLWVVPFEGGPARQLTAADSEDKSPAWSPDGSRIAFLSARGGDDAKTRVWVMDVRGGEARPVTGDKLDVLTFAWSPSGDSLAFVAQDPKPEARDKEEKAGRDWTVVDHDLRPRRLHLVAMNGAAAGDTRPVPAAGERSVWELDWSPDGEWIVATVSDTPRTDDSYVFKKVVALPIRLSKALAVELVGIVGKVDQVAWSRDGRSIACRAGVDASDPFSGSVFLVPAPSGRVIVQPASAARVNLTGDRKESVQRIDWLPDGALAAVSVSGTRTNLSVLDPAEDWRPRPWIDSGPEVFTSASWSTDGRRMAMAASTPDGPAEVYAAERPGRGERSRMSLHRITSVNSDLDPLPRGKQEVFRYAARDGLEIEGILIRPVSYPGRASWPLVVIVHGGPESQYLNGWNTSYAVPGQALAERGYFVFYPNYRGSTGRGVAFSKADHQDLGGREFDDVLDGIDALTGRFPIDRKRVGITGGSYGGYFTALGVTRHSDRFAAGVELFGISNWVSFIGQTDTPAENSNVHWALWCYEHADACWKASPIAHVGKAATPTLILHGEKDERVPKPQGDELYAALKWKGVPVEYVVFPREKHGFRERAHQIETFDRLLAWMEKYLKPLER